MPAPFRQILGIRFFAGDLEGLLNLASEGGLIVVPSAPVLADMSSDPAHLEALLGSDFAITDSGFMVFLWMLLRGERLPRISGLRFMRGLFNRPEFRRPGATFWVMPSVEDARINCEWMRRQGLAVTMDDCYMAPQYPGGRLDDPALLSLIEARRPQFVMINVGGGVQERLGYFLKSRLSHRPAILCTGAAIAFLSGRQVQIPVWADRLILGWLFRSLASPRSFIPRLWKSLRVAPLLWKYGEKQPQIRLN